MTLFSLQHIKRALNEKFAPLEPMLTGLRLIDGGLDDAAVAKLESMLGTKFPEAYREAIQAYNFGLLTIGPVAFCNTGDYSSELAELNTSAHWWGRGARPSELLMIANSDPFAILLDVETGAVLAMDPSQGPAAARRVAADFEAYLRGIGTVMLSREAMVDKTALGKEVASLAKSVDSDYWIQLAS